LCGVIFRRAHHHHRYNKKRHHGDGIHMFPEVLPATSYPHRRYHHRKTPEAPILRELFNIERMLTFISVNIQKNVRTLANMGTDHYNEERAEVQSSGDRVSQLQKTLTGKVDDLRANIMLLMTSQQEMHTSLLISLNTMMGVLKELIPKKGGQ